MILIQTSKGLLFVDPMNPSDVTHPTQESRRDLAALNHGMRLSHKTLIHADPMQVYKALTTSDGLDAWFTSGARVNAVPGGEIHFRWEDWGPEHISTEDAGTVLEAIPAAAIRLSMAP